MSVVERVGVNDVVVTVRFLVPNMVSREEVGGNQSELFLKAAYILAEEGILGITNDPGRVLSAEWARPPARDSLTESQSIIDLAMKKVRRDAQLFPPWLMPKLPIKKADGV